MMKQCQASHVLIQSIEFSLNSIVVQYGSVQIMNPKFILDQARLMQSIFVWRCSILAPTQAVQKLKNTQIKWVYHSLSWIMVVYHGLLLFVSIITFQTKSPVYDCALRLLYWGHTHIPVLLIDSIRLHLNWIPRLTISRLNTHQHPIHIYIYIIYLPNMAERNIFQQTHQQGLQESGGCGAKQLRDWQGEEQTQQASPGIKPATIAIISSSSLVVPFPHSQIFPVKMIEMVVGCCWFLTNNIHWHLDKHTSKHTDRHTLTNLANGLGHKLVGL